jgi:hypothetical protein
MVEQNILKKELHKVLGIFNSKGYFPVSKEIRSEILKSLSNLIQLKTPKEIRPLCLLGLVARSGHADKILGNDQASVLSQNSIRFFSNSEEKLLSPEFNLFLHSALEALTLSQQSAGAD